MTKEASWKGETNKRRREKNSKKEIVLVPQEGEFLPQWQRKEGAFIAFPYIGGMSSNEMKIIWRNIIISWLKSIPVKL